MGIENIKGLDKATKSNAINKKSGLFWCAECDNEIKQKDLIFNEETDSFICRTCGRFIEYISKK